MCNCEMKVCVSLKKGPENLFPQPASPVRRVLAASSDRFLYFCFYLCSSHWFEAGGALPCHRLWCTYQDFAIFELL